jgi:hypothetical protein
MSYDEIIRNGTSNVNVTLTSEQLKEFAEMVATATVNQVLDQREEKIYTREEIFKMFPICSTTLNKWQKNGTIRYRKIGNRVFYPESEIKRLSSLK